MVIFDSEFRATRKLQERMLLYKWDVKRRKNPWRKFVCFQSEAGKYSPRLRTFLNGANFRDRTRQTLNNEPAANERRSLCPECVTRARRSLGDIKYLINIPIARRIGRIAVARLRSVIRLLCNRFYPQMESKIAAASRRLKARSLVRANVLKLANR